MSFISSKLIGWCILILIFLSKTCFHLLFEIFLYPLDNWLRADTSSSPEEVLRSSGNLENKCWKPSDCQWGVKLSPSTSPHQFVQVCKLSVTGLSATAFWVLCSVLINTLPNDRSYFQHKPITPRKYRESLKEPSVHHNYLVRGGWCCRNSAKPGVFRKDYSLFAFNFTLTLIFHVLLPAENKRIGSCPTKKAK